MLELISEKGQFSAKQLCTLIEANSPVQIWQETRQIDKATGKIKVLAALANEPTIDQPRLR